MSVRWYQVVFLSVASSGCASIADHHYDRVAKSRAKAAWKCAASNISEECQNHDFEKGYKAGYHDVSIGGNGACPPVPPNCYWGAEYQCSDGLNKVNMWYCGFNQGAQHAIRDGRNCLHNIPSADQSPCCQTPCSPIDNYPQVTMESGFTQGLLPMSEHQTSIVPQPMNDHFN